MYTYSIVVIPKDVRWRLGAMPDYAGKVDSTAAIDVQFRTADDLRIRLWKSKTRKNFINMYKRRSIRVAR